MSKEKNEEVWVICPECKTKLKKENISDHLKRVHDKKIEDFNESLIKILSKKEKKQKAGRSIALVAVIILILIVVGVVILAFATGFFGSSNNENQANSSSWLNTYTPVHSLGDSNNDFWVDHPIDGTISHPQWVKDSLKNGSVVFVVHRMYCTWCAPQAERVITLAEKYKKENLVFYDLDIDQGGDLEKKGYDALIYDPDGPPHYIALTVIITLIEKDGKIEYAWHAWEGDMTEAEIENWMKDAMYYHHINSGV